jgi:hypothetical protein
LLKKAKTLPQIAAPKDNLPKQLEEGFFGRSRELWQIEKAFVQGTRRITIAGFGGQGKTYLAVEAGRWLSQTGMFEAVVFVDYAAFQGLVQVEYMGTSFLRFHPTLAPVLWGRLTAEAQGEMRLRYQQVYYALAGYLYNQDSKNPEAVRTYARRELPNLLWAVNGALDDQAENAVEFVTSVNMFLDNFGIKRDRAFLTERLDRAIEIVGSESWCLVRSSQGEQLYDAGQYQAAAN